MPTRPIRRLSLAIPLTLLSGAALADAERLEADLRALFVDTPGELSIGEVSDGLLGGSTSAEDLVFLGDDGDRVRLDRYTVEGDYARPEEVIMEGLRVEARGGERGTLSADRLVIAEPSRPLLPLDDLPLDGSLEAAELIVEGLAIVHDGTWREADGGAGRFFGESGGRLDIEHLQATDLSRRAIGSLEMTGIGGSGEALGELGAGTFSLAALRLEGLRGLDEEGEESLDRLEMRDLAIDAEQMVGAFERLLVDGDMGDGAGGLWLEALELDLARMIALAPAEERTQLRMASNVLTGGSGQLRLDAAFDGRWESSGDKSLLESESRIDAADAFRWTLDADLPVRLPEGVEPAAFLAGMDSLEGVTLLGGEIRTTLTDLGLFGRLPAVMALGQGVSETDFLAQARTQAKGLGTMLGPEFQAILVGLVDMMEGKAGELAVRLSLPAESSMDKLADDPLGLPSRLSMRVETR